MAVELDHDIGPIVSQICEYAGIAPDDVAEIRLTPGAVEFKVYLRSATGNKYVHGVGENTCYACKPYGGAKRYRKLHGETVEIIPCEQWGQVAHEWRTFDAVTDNEKESTDG